MSQKDNQLVKSAIKSIKLISFSQKHPFRLLRITVSLDHKRKRGQTCSITQSQLLKKPWSTPSHLLATLQRCLNSRFTKTIWTLKLDLKTLCMSSLRFHKKKSRIYLRLGTTQIQSRWSSLKSLSYRQFTLEMISHLWTKLPWLEASSNFWW